MLREIRRISAVALAAALAVGLAAHGMGSSDMSFEPAMTAAANDMSANDMPANMPMSGKRDGCGDDQNGMAAACAAFCSSVVALQMPTILQQLTAVDVLRPSAGQDATGHVGPPDPYPPRPTSIG